MSDITIETEIEGAPDLDDDEQRAAWRVESDRAASWAIRRMAAACAEAARLDQAFNDEVAALVAWRDAALTSPQRDADFFEGALIDYRRRLEADNPGLAKTYKVPGGQITRRAGSESLEVLDDEAFIQWALAHGRDDLIRASFTVNKSDVKGAGFNVMADTGTLVTEDGEGVPGVRIVRGGDRYGATAT